MAATNKEILTEIRAMRDTQTHILRVQERQQANLEEHMRRTSANEEAVTLMRQELAPLKTHAAIWGALSKVLVAAGALVGVATGVARLLGAG